MLKIGDRIRVKPSEELEPYGDVYGTVTELPRGEDDSYGVSLDGPFYFFEDELEVLDED